MKYLQTEVITFVLLLLVSLFHHQFVPNLYQCHAIHEKTAMPMTGRFHIYPGARCKQFQSLVWVTKSPRAHQLLGFFRVCVCVCVGGGGGV